MKKRHPRRAELIHAVQTLEPRQLLSYSISPNSAVVMNTSLGEVAIELDTNSPITTANFLSYVTAGSYSNTVFHRIAISGQTQLNEQTESYSIVQGGGYTNNSGTFTPIATLGGLANGTIYTSIPLSGTLADAIPAGTALTLINNSDGETQDVVLSSDANVGDATLSVNSFTTTDAFPSGSTIDEVPITAGQTYTTINLSSELSAPIDAGTTLTLTNTSGDTQDVTVASYASAEGTSITVDSFTAGNTYATGSTVEEAGTEIDTLAGSEIGTVTGIVNEATTSGNSNTVGTIAMARTSGTNSASSQFFFNVTDNSSYFDANASEGSTGYAVFGNVIRGLGIVDTIDNLSPETVGNFSNVPETSSGGFVTINTATEEDTMTVTIGPHDAAGDHTVSFRDPTTGAGTNISLNGADATITFTGTGLAAQRNNGNLVITGTNLELQELASTDTTAKTNLVFSNPGRNKHINLGDINITGSINSITGVGVNLTGDLAVTGSVNKIDMLATNAAGFISIDTDAVANAPATYIDIPFLADVSIQSGGAIKELITRSYTVDDGTSRGISTDGNIAKVLVYGSMGASIESNGNIGKIQAGDTGGEIEAGGTIDTIDIAQMEGGVIYAGQAYDAKTLDIKTIKIQGVLDNTRVLSAGNIGSIKAESVDSSTFVAGYDTSGSDQAADGFAYALAANAYIKSLTLRTLKGNATSFTDSEIAAYEIDSLHLGRVATTIGTTYPVLGIQAVDLKSLVATTDQKQSLDLSKVTSQATLNALIAKKGLKLNTTATVGTIASGTASTTGLTAGYSYSSIPLTNVLTTTIPAGTVLTLVSGSDSQTVTLSADADAGDTSQTLSVTPFTANADYASGSTIQGTASDTTSTSLASGVSYSGITLSAGIVTPISAGAVITIVSGSDTQTATVSAAAAAGATTLNVTPFTANADYAAGVTVTGTDAATTTTGLTNGDSYTALALNDPTTTTYLAGSAITITGGSNGETVTATIAEDAEAGATSLTVDAFTANDDYAAGSTIEDDEGNTVGTLATGTTTTTGTLAGGTTPGVDTVGSSATGTSTGLASGLSYTTINLSAPLTAAFASGAAVTLVSGNNSQTVALSAAASVGDTSLTATSFIANANYPAGSTIQGVGFTIDIIPASDIGVAAPVSSS